MHSENIGGKAGGMIVAMVMRFQWRTLLEKPSFRKKKKKPVCSLNI